MNIVRPLVIFLVLAGLPAAAADLAQLSWLSGCWAYDDGDPGSGEYWMRPVAGSMLAVTRTVKDGRTVGFEYLRIAAAVQVGSMQRYNRKWHGVMMM